jgi:putative ABC transport system ATP-binding protein
VKVAIEDLAQVYGPPDRLRPVLAVGRLAIDSGAHLCVVGRSGSGKTTLLNILCGVLRPTRGRVYLGDIDLFALDEPSRDALRAQRIGCVFQALELLDGLTALENLTLAQRFAGISGERARRRAEELLERVGLRDKAGARAAELSVGEQQRVAIARAVSKAPGLVLADEPTASLDDESAQLATDLLIETCRERTLIVASHDARLIRRFASTADMAHLDTRG